MKTLLTFVLSSLSSVATPLLIAFLLSRADKEKPRRTENNAMEIKYSKSSIVLGIVLSVILLVGVILLGINYFRSVDINKNLILFGMCVTSLFLIISWVGLFDALWFLMIVSEDRIQYRFFPRKMREISLEDIRYYARIPRDPLDNFICYDKNGVALLRTDAMVAGLPKLEAFLQQNGIESFDMATAEIRNSIPHRCCVKQRNAFRYFLICAFLGGLFLTMACMMNALEAPTPPYENYSVTGSVEYCSISEKDKSKSVNIALYGDEYTYRISSVVFEEVSPSFPDTIPAGKEIELKVAYEGPWKVRHVSGIAIDGTEYLDPVKAEQAERSNDKTVVIFIKALFVISGLLLLAGVGMIIRCSVLKKKMQQAVQAKQMPSVR